MKQHLSFRHILIACAGLTAGLPGLAGESTSGPEAWVDPRPLGRGLATYRPPREAPSTPEQLPPLAEPTGVLSLRQALALALAGSPELAAVAWDVRIGEARMVQAGLRPNPEVGLELENVLGTSDYRGLREAELTLQLSQLIELGGKRTARLEAAERSRDLAAWDYETLRLAVVSQTAAAFFEVLGLQQRLALTEETLRLAEEIAGAVRKRVEAAKTLPVESTKAQLALASAQVEREQTQAALATARVRLAASWGSNDPRFERVDGSLDRLPPVPQREALLERLRQNPELERWATEILQREASLRLETAKARPDVTVSGGVRRFHGSDANALTLGVSIPWPRFDRNQGNIREARLQLAKAKEERRAVEQRVTAEVTQAWYRLSAIAAHVTSLNEKVLPPARQTFEAMNQYYREGRLSYLEVLDAQRAFVEARAQHLQALTEYHTAVLALERLIGEPLSVPAVL